MRDRTTRRLYRQDDTHDGRYLSAADLSIVDVLAGADATSPFVRQVGLRY